MEYIFLYKVEQELIHQIDMKQVSNTITYTTLMLQTIPK